MSADVFVAPSGRRWSTVIGLEVHCQLSTRTKLFCACPNAFGARPNSLTCPVCTGQPGALPVLNRRALELAVRAAVLVGAEVAEVTHFDRKNYFYCDLPKGYQISQLDRPVCTGGGVDLASGKRVRLARIHLEEDAGKAIHDRGDATLVDLNRAGVPLIEAVSEADLAGADEAVEYLQALRLLLRYAEVSDCDMEQGSLRCDVNVSVRPAAEPDAPLRTKVEIKNLNSFRAAHAAIEYEVARQVRAYESGDPRRFPVQETRLFDTGSGETRPMRGKEDADDYRYFPDPDLPPVRVPAELVAAERAALPELPAARRLRYTRDLGLSDYDAGVLTSRRALADFFERTAEQAAEPGSDANWPKLAANWITNGLLTALADPECPATELADLRLTPAGLAELLRLIARGTVHATAAREVLRAMLASGRPAGELVRELGLEQVDDEARLEAWCRAALLGREAVADEVRAGNVKALGALMGPVMKASGGQANPAAARALFLRLIGAEPE